MEVPNQVKKFEWQKTFYEYTPQERSEIIKQYAMRLGRELNDGNPVDVIKIDADGHGHGLDIAYEVKDKQGRTWRAEWDGIGRNYDVNSNMIPESVRGGHIEIVTPKFSPTSDDIKHVFKAMEKENLIPMSRFGGGHINIDLAPFEGKPKKMARFLGAYLDNRNVMSMMFQHPGRQIGAEPFKVSQETIQRLKNFNGSEEDLKKLLYNEKLFNTRVGRKTKNSQLNLTAYFQDVIPEKYLHEDFDMKNDMWRRTFDVEPKIRKMEFRMFNAPRNQAESALQIKFTRALLNKALNESDEVFTTNGMVDYEKLLNNPDYAFQEFEKTMTKLGLDKNEYRGLFMEGMLNTKDMLDSKLYVPLEHRLSMHPEIRDWDPAVGAREIPISSEGRKWAGNNPLPEAIVYKQQQMLARQAAENTRSFVSVNDRIVRSYDSKLPYELTLKIDQIKKLESPGQRLSALYFNKNKLSDDYEFDELLKKSIKQAKKDGYLMEVARNHATGDGNKSKGYIKFLAEQVNPKKVKESHTYFYRSLIFDEDPELRLKARNYMMSFPDGQQNIFNTAISNLESSYGNRDNGTSLLKLFDKIDKADIGIQDFSSADNFNFGDLKNRKNKQVALRVLRLMVDKDPDAYNKALIRLAQTDSPTNIEFSLKRMEKTDPFRFELLRNDYIKKADADPALKKKLLKMGDPDFFKKVKMNQIDTVEGRDKLRLMHETYLAGSDLKKQQVLNNFRKIDNLETLKSGLGIADGTKADSDLGKWVMKHLPENEAFSKLIVPEKPKEISGFRMVAAKQINQIKRFLGSDIDPDLDPDALEKLRVEKVNLAKEKELDEFISTIVKAKDKNNQSQLVQFFDSLPEGDYKNNKAMWTILGTKDVNSQVKKELLARIRQNPKLMPRIKNSNSTPFVEDVLKPLRNQMVNDKSLTKDIAYFLAKHPDIEFNYESPLYDLLDTPGKNPSTSEKRLGYYLLGVKHSNYTHDNLPDFIAKNTGAENALERRILERGKVKHFEFIKNFKGADLKEMSAANQLRFLQERFELTGDVELTSALSGNKKELSSNLRYYAGMNLPEEKMKVRDEFILKLLEENKFQRLLDPNNDDLMALVGDFLLSDSEDIRNKARNLMQKSGVSLADLTRSNDFVDNFFNNSKNVMRVLQENPISEADFVKLSKQAPFSDKLVQALASMGDYENRTLSIRVKNKLTQLAKKIPGDQVSKSILAKSTEIKNSSYVLNVLKKKKSRYAIDAIESIASTKNGNSNQKEAKELLSNFYKNVKKDLNRFDELTLSEQINVLYRNQRKDPTFNPQSYLSRLKGTPKDIVKELTTRTKPIEYDFSLFMGNSLSEKADTPLTRGSKEEMSRRFMQWYADLLVDPKNVEELGLNDKHIKELISKIKNHNVKSKVANKKLALKVLEENKVLSRTQKLNYIQKRFNPDARTLDALKVYAQNGSGHPVFSHFVTKTLVHDSVKLGPVRGRSASELMLMMPKSDVEKVISSTKNVELSDKSKELLLLGAAKHNDSPLVSSYVQELVDSGHPRLKELSEKITTNLSVQSATTSGNTQLRCSGRTVRQLLNRLTFR